MHTLRRPGGRTTAAPNPREGSTLAQRGPATTRGQANRMHHQQQGTITPIPKQIDCFACGRPRHKARDCPFHVPTSKQMTTKRVEAPDSSDSESHLFTTFGFPPHQLQHRRQLPAVPEQPHAVPTALSIPRRIQTAKPLHLEAAQTSHSKMDSGHDGNGVEKRC